MDPRYEVTKDVRGQIKFLEELDKAEQKRHEEQEREMLMRAAKSRSKTEDPEQAKLKAKVRAASAPGKRRNPNSQIERFLSLSLSMQNIVFLGERNATCRNGRAPAARRQFDRPASHRAAKEAQARGRSLGIHHGKNASEKHQFLHFYN